MQLKTPSAPFSHVPVTGDSITIDTTGKVIVLPTGNADILPSHNEYTLNSNRLTIAESPFGGLKGSQSPDYSVGTLYTPTDGVYLTDINGQNSTKTLTAGKQKEIGTLTVDTVAHTITQEFIVANMSESNNHTVISDGSSTSGWSTSGNCTLSTENGKLKVFGQSSSSSGIKIIKTVNLNGYKFIKFKITCNVNKYLFVFIYQNPNSVEWRGSRFPILANMETTFVLPLLAPVVSTGQNPSGASGTINWSNNVLLYIGTDQTDASEITFYIDDIQADTAKPAYIELQTPDNLADTSLVSQKWTGSTYETNRTLKLDSVATLVSSDTTKMVFNDGTKFDDVYGTGNGRSNFPKSSAGETKTGTLSGSSMTYSSNAGTSKRIGFRVDLPPSDGGRTSFNSVRFKIITYYSTDPAGKRSASFTFTDSTNASYGLQNLTNPWIALYDPTSNLIDFYLFTHRPKNLEFKRDESGNIYELKLYPGNGSIYHGQITHSNLTLDSDSDFIPNCLEASIEGSVTKFLQSYGMVI